jgi:hypothetical protein
MDWKDEPKAIKAALIDRGFKVISSKKGTGTARSWNKVKVAERYNDWSQTYSEVSRIGAAICGHDNISVSID